MSRLRKQIQAAKAQYAAQAYDGDLAADVLDGRSRVLVLRRLAVAAAVAAVMVLAIVLWPGPQQTSKVASRHTATPVVVAVVPPASQAADQAFSLTDVQVPDMTATSGMSLVPSFGPMTGMETPRITDAVPADETTATTKETTL